jgi:hypothetical protein
VRRLLALLALLGVTAPALAQGTVNFNNNVFGTPTSRPVLDYPGGHPLIGTDFVAQLYYGSVGTPATSLTPVGAPGRFRLALTTNPGSWMGGTRTLNGILAGQTASLQVRVWNVTAFPTYEASLVGGGVRGTSPVFDYTVPLGPMPAPNEFWMWNFSWGRTIPEPSTTALGVLGAMVLLFARRQT